MNTRAYISEQPQLSDPTDLDFRGAQRPGVLEARCPAQPDEVLDVQRAAKALAQQHRVLADLPGKRGGRAENTMKASDIL